MSQKRNHSERFRPPQPLRPAEHRQMRRVDSRLFALVLVLAGAACGSPAVGPDAGSVDATSTTTPATADVVAVAVTGADGAAPTKGARLAVTLTVANEGGPGSVRLTPLVTCPRFTDFVAIPLGSVDVPLSAGQRLDVPLTAGPFLVDDAGAHFALGRGACTIPAVRVELDGAAATPDASFDGGDFAIAASDAVFDVVLHDPAYFTAIGWRDTPEAYVRSAYTRASELFTPASPGASTGTYQPLARGFDALMQVEHHVLALPGLAASAAGGGFCEQVTAHARVALGLARDWDVDEGQEILTDADHHGFDVLVGLTPALGGGAACGWLGVQVSGLFSFDLSLDRSQIILVHETGHLFGAPHCDPMQGYVMCAGEQHAHYQDDGVFVWHAASRAVMSNRWR